MNLPKIGEALTQEQVEFLKMFTKSCRRSIVEMTMNSQSGHPGGSCSVIDYLALLYCFIISQTGEDVVVSNGHVSPAVYTILGHMGYIPWKMPFGISEKKDLFMKAILPVMSEG